MRFHNIDNGQDFDFGNTSINYAKYRDIYPQSLYDNLKKEGVCSTNNSNLLDIGTGTGVLPRGLQPFNGKIMGIDISENQIIQARKISGNKENLSFCVAAAEQIPFEDMSFDTVTACQCYQYFDKRRAIPEISRVLKKNGKFFKIFMTWIPSTSNYLMEMESLILKYNPNWSGYGYKPSKIYSPDSYLLKSFSLKKRIVYNEELHFDIETWVGRVSTCRGLGACLPIEKVEDFNNNHRKLIAKYFESNCITICHEIEIECYSKKF